MKNTLIKIFCGIYLGFGCQSNTPEPRRRGVSAPPSSENFVPIKHPSVDSVSDEKLKDWQSEFLTAHNGFRAEVGVSELKWSKQLEDVALDWANQLKDAACAMKHRPNGKFGENLFWSKMRSRSPEEVVEAWGSEKEDYNYASNSCRSGAVCGHYTQIVWSQTQHVGCARSACVSEKEEIWVCNYNPPGNYIGRKPY